MLHSTGKGLRKIEKTSSFFFLKRKGKAARRSFFFFFFYIYMKIIYLQPHIFSFFLLISLLS